MAFGLQEGAPPDRFLVGLAVLTLLSQVAEDRPVLCVVDDAQWLDAASARVLGFVARRLVAEPVGLVFAARQLGEELSGLTELELLGLPDREARALLASVVGFGLDGRVRDQILAEMAGNPLALLELPRGLTRAELAGGFGLVGAVPERIEQGFRRRIEALPAETRSLLLVVAADPSGDLALVWRAAERLDIPATAIDAAQSDGLVEIGARVRFRHPLVRSAAYSFAALPQRRAAHWALAEETDRDADPDRRAWHLAAAAPGPDEEVAAELERSAGRARARGGMAATAALLGRSVELTADPARRSGRALAAAQANLQAGAFDAASEELDLAAAGPLDELQQARTALLRGQIAFASSFGSEAPALLVRAAKQLEPLDAALARETYLDAWAAALFAGRLAVAGNIYEVSRAARSAPPAPHSPRPSDWLLDGVAVAVIEGRAAAAPTLRHVAHLFSEGEISTEEGLRWAWLASIAPIMLWDEESWHAGLVRQLKAVREAGLLVHLPIYLNGLGILTVWCGEFTTADSLIAEADAMAKATGASVARFAAVLAAGLRETETVARQLIDSETRDARDAGQGVGIQWCQWASAIFYNGHSRYEEAAIEAQQAAEQAPELYVSMWSLPELIEAASRTGQNELAAGALERLAEATGIAETDWGQGIYARCRALLSDGRVAEDSYREALERLSRTQLRPDLARAHLVYGEWLRRERRRAEARAQLRTAHEMFDAIGMLAFAERARRELGATGETARKRTAATHGELTPQEAQIARLAASRLPNLEIAAQLFLSPHTVDYHLRKVFTKLGVTSRRQLRQALLDSDHHGSTV